MLEFKAKKNPLPEREQQLGAEVAWTDKADSSQTARQAPSGKEECGGGGGKQGNIVTWSYRETQLLTLTTPVKHREFHSWEENEKFEIKWWKKITWKYLSLKLLEVISISRAPVPGVSGHSVFTSGCFRVQELRVTLPFLLGHCPSCFVTFGEEIKHIFAGGFASCTNLHGAAHSAKSEVGLGFLVI